MSDPKDTIIIGRVAGPTMQARVGMPTKDEGMSIRFNYPPIRQVSESEVPDSNDAVSEDDFTFLKELSDAKIISADQTARIYGKIASGEWEIEAAKESNFIESGDESSEQLAPWPQAPIATLKKQRVVPTILRQPLSLERVPGNYIAEQFERLFGRASYQRVFAQARTDDVNDYCACIQSGGSGRTYLTWRARTTPFVLLCHWPWVYIKAIIKGEPIKPKQGAGW